MVADLEINVARDLAVNRGGTFLLQRTNRTVLRACPVIDNPALIDVAGAGQLCTVRTDVDIALFVEAEVSPAELAVRLARD